LVAQGTDNCERVGLIFDDVIGSVDIINSKNCEVEVKGVTPSFVVRAQQPLWAAGSELKALPV